MGLRRDRKFEIILYPDSDVYDCDVVIQRAISYFSAWAYCLHYGDTTDDGELKKAHIHFLGKLSDPIEPSLVCKDLSLPVNAIANVKSWKAACRYLIHLDSPDKFQYSPDDVVTSFPILAFFSLPDEDQARRIIEYISQSGCTKVSDLTLWALNNGCYSGLRRGFAIWNQILREN
jgi:hypothetical protein